MQQKLRVTTKKGYLREAEVDTLTLYIGGVAEKFALLDDPVRVVDPPALIHVRSGKSLGDLGSIIFSYKQKGDPISTIQAAQLLLDGILANVGPERVLARLHDALQIND